MSRTPKLSCAALLAFGLCAPGCGSPDRTMMMTEDMAVPTDSSGMGTALALDDVQAQRARAYPDRSLATEHPIELPLVADRERARFSSWYELFPRSSSPTPGRHGTFKDVVARLPAIAAMGFDVLYFPPIHPIGREQRKGRNNALVAQADDVGSPWAIGAAEGGHKSILPALGKPADFLNLVKKARALGIDVISPQLAVRV